MRPVLEQRLLPGEVTGYAVVHTEGWEEGPEHFAPEILVDEISIIELQEHDEVGNALY